MKKWIHDIIFKPIRFSIKGLLTGFLAAGVIMLTSCKDGADNRIPESGTTLDLTSAEWRLWIDSTARWSDDTLYLPPADLRQIRANAPGCGWEKLYSKGIDVQIPATVEEYFWDHERDKTRLDGVKLVMAGLSEAAINYIERIRQWCLNNDR